VSGSPLPPKGGGEKGRGNAAEGVFSVVNRRRLNIRSWKGEKKRKPPGGGKGGGRKSEL